MMRSSIELEVKFKSNASQRKGRTQNENDNLCNSWHNDGSGSRGRFPDGPDSRPGNGDQAGSRGNNCSGFDLRLDPKDGRDSGRRTGIRQSFKEGEEAFGQSEIDRKDSCRCTHEVV
jgi:hypothetical protein